MSLREMLGDTPSADYCEYFFLRNRGDGGFVVTADSSVSPFLFAASMGAHDRGNQLFKFLAIANDDQCAMLIHQATQQAVCWGDASGQLVLKDPSEGGEQARWSISATDQLQPAAIGGTALELSVDAGAPGRLGLANSSAASTSQQFEQLFPSDFVAIRNSWTGRLLTAGPNQAVSWELMNPANSDAQQWGITSDGRLVNRGSAEILQLSSPTPSEGTLLNTGVQVSIGDGAAYQSFDIISSGDGTFRSAGGFALGADASGHVVAVTYSATDYTLLLEPVSPFQFFRLMDGVNGGNQEWLARSGATTVISGPGGGIEQLFTVSRYGEIISPIDGFVLQNQGIGQPPGFVDPAPDPIGFDSTTFQCIPGANPGWDQIGLRSNTQLSLLSAAVQTGSQPWIYWAQPPVGGCQAWQMVGASGTLFAAYQDIARTFFLNPAPLPGQPALIRLEAHPELQALVGDNQKTAQVIYTIVAGILDIAAGISFGSLGSAGVTKLAQIVLGSEEVAAKIAVVMQGAITAASVIAIADGITKAGLWWQIFQLLIPNSFWGWALTVAKVSLTIAAWAVGAGPAITGAKIAMVVTSVLVILNSDVDQVAIEADRLQAYVRRLNATSPARIAVAA